MLVRDPEDLAGVDALVLPGGESTTISMLLDSAGLRGPLGERLAAGTPVLGTCAGMILLARDVLDGRVDQQSFGVLDLSVRRNAYGRQVDSFEADLEADPAVWPSPEGGRPVHAVFIRAPWVEDAGPGVAVLARVADGPAAGRIVAVRLGSLLATSFHPELTSDGRVHAQFLEMVREALR